MSVIIKIIISASFTDVHQIDHGLLESTFEQESLSKIQEILQLLNGNYIASMVI